MENKRHDWSKEDYIEYRRKINREAQRKRRALAKKNGMCSICGNYAPEKGKKTCQYCISRVVEWQKRGKGI